MRTLIDPPLESWRLGLAADADRHTLPPLGYPVGEGGTAPSFDVTRAIIATGHQPWLWHPGILAKDFAVVSAARRLGATPLHLVVDHDVLDPLRIDLPVRREDRLEIETLHLGLANTAVPVGAQPAVDSNQATDVLREARDRLGDALVVDVQPLIEAIEATQSSADSMAVTPSHTTAPRSLAAQISAWLAALRRPYCGDIPMLPSSALLHTEPGEALLAQMLGDAARCARCYNDAVAQHTEAGIGPLLIERERVELPVWALRWHDGRQRVFADLADTTPLLTFEDGTPLPSAAYDGSAPPWLAPRALLLTALMRSRFCDMFVHGKGGGVYDRAAEHWWQHWRNESLAPRAVVSADVYLEFDVPIAEADDLAHALWYRHHAPFNVDRLLGLDGPLAMQKQRLIHEMDADRDHRRRWLAFREIRRLNAALGVAHADVLRDAERQLATARQAVGNARIARKRDWCFALYPPGALEALRDAVSRAAQPCS